MTEVDGYTMKLCKPYRSGIQAVFIIVFTAVFVLLSAAMWGLYPHIGKYFGGAAAAFIFIGCTLLYRYTLTEFEYCLEGGILSVRKSVGFLSSTVFSLQLDGKTRLTLNKKDCKREKAKGVSYRQNLTAATAFIIYEQAGKARYMEFEPNYEFYGIIKAELEKYEDKTQS